MAQSESKGGGILSTLLVIICFVIGCLFIYWAVQYWVYNNFDRGRYGISKIRPADGGDSWSFWKLDRRTGNVEYCSLEINEQKAAAHPDDPAKGKEFVCVRAKIVEAKEVEEDKAPQPPIAEAPTEENNAADEDAVIATTPEITSQDVAEEPSVSEEEVNSEEESDEEATAQ